jgi:hypothetical protein
MMACGVVLPTTCGAILVESSIVLVQLASHSFFVLQTSVDHVEINLMLHGL